MGARWVWIVFAGLTAGLLAVGPAHAAKDDSNNGDRWPGTRNHSGTAPVHAPKADDENFVVDIAGGELDTGCTYRNGGPLTFSVPVDRVVGDVKADGTLADPALLIRNKVVAAKARLSMPAYDVDSSAVPDPPAKPEVDRVFFNGHELSKPLTGANDTWIMNELEVPIEFVRFPARAASGEKPEPVENQITIEIDTANTDIGQEVWCTAIDWARLQVKAMAPILLVHGIDSGPEAAWPNVAQYLREQKIPFEGNIQLTSNGAVDANGKQLAGIVANEAMSFGVGKVHLVVHSKGGLDSRRYLSTYYEPDKVRVLSLHTLSTPHQGSVLSDLSYANRTKEEAESEDPDLNNYLTKDSWVNALGKGPQRPGLDDLRTDAARTFNQNNHLPAGVRLYTYGADADIDNDGKISESEGKALLGVLAKKAGSLLYPILRDVSSIKVTRKTRYFGSDEYHEVSPVATVTAQDNDLAVTDTSSRYAGEILHDGPLDRNHADIKDSASMQRVLERIRADFPVR